MKKLILTLIILLPICLLGQEVLKTVKVNKTCNLNAQPIPRTDYMQIKKGQSVDVLDIVDVYYQVNYKGNIGYVLDLFIYDADLIRIKQQRIDNEIARRDSIAKSNRIASKQLLIERYGTYKASLIEKKKVCIGMSMEEALASWGDPSSINKSTYSFGTHEQWVYEGENFKNRYLYFEDGVLKAIQE